MRYRVSGQLDDLEQSTLGFTQAIYLPLLLDSRPRDLNIVQIFHSLTLALFVRAEESRQPKDVRYCIMYLRYLREQWYEVPVDMPFPVAGTLICTLAIQVELKLGDVDHDIEEMAELFDELLNSDTSNTFLTDPTIAFARVVDANLEGPIDGQVPSEKVIRCLRMAIRRLPDLHDGSIVLAQSLFNRFNITASDDDYNEGMAILDKVIAFRDSGDRLSPYSERALALASTFAFVRFSACGKPEHLEQAIYRTRIWLEGTSLEDPTRTMIAEFLSDTQSMRSHGSRSRTIVQGMPSGTSEPTKIPLFQDLSASLLQLNPVNPLPLSILIKHRNAFQSINLLTDIADIEDGIKYCRELIASHPDSPLAFITRFALPELFYRVFECTNEIEHLNKAISASRDNIKVAVSPILQVPRLLNLISFLSTRLFLLRCREDLEELMQLFPIAANNEHAGVPCQDPIPCRWALIARAFGHSSSLTAYDRAMSSMQASLTFAPTLDKQHSRLTSISDPFKGLPLDYGSYQIRTNRLKQAIETLERGRVLLWSEMRGLRTSIDKIRLADSHLADRFSAVNTNLETLTLAFSPGNDVDDGDNDLEGMGTFSHLVVQQRKLLDDREKLISQIQALPGLDTFLKPPSFDTAACHGPVIIINHSKWRSDILILLNDSPPSLITTSRDFYARANELQDQLLVARKKGLESENYEDALRSVLKDLHDLVGRPVIERLKELNVPEQSRVWWCPTSVFCSLPLHAMGPIPPDRDGGPLRYFMDLYIPSYTPSLSALIESRKPGSQAIGKPSILLVTQPDEKMPLALKEMTSVQAVDTQVTTLFSVKATPIAVLARLRDHRFAHIVCHGVLEPGKPFEA